MNLKNIHAILFDFDGVLMQSIEDHHRSWNEVFRSYDTEIGWEEFSVLEGQSLYTIARQLCQRHGIDESESEKIGRTKNEIYLRSAKLKLYDGVFPLLDTVKEKKLKMALVTGAHRDRFERSVNERFLSYFDAVVTADDVTHTKPDPEPFRMASSKLGMKNHECIVVENAPLGITSAKQAGMYCVALTTTLSDRWLKDADLIINNLDDLRNKIMDTSP
jgi:beta-phosphoglucomutase